MTKVLGIDASTEGCSVALYVDGVFYEKNEVCPQGHTKLLLPMVDEILKEHALSLADLDFLACGKGPGSFTGVRIGVSITQGLALGSDKKVVGICDLEAMADNAMEETKCEYAVSAIDARMGEVYLGIYHLENKKLVSLIEESVVKPEEAITKIKETLGNNKFAYSGTAFTTYSNLKESMTLGVASTNNLPMAKSVVNLALNSSERLEPEELLPLYVRDTVTWKKVSEQK